MLRAVDGPHLHSAGDLEILRIAPLPDIAGWRQVELAIGGVRCVPLDIPEERFRSFRTDADLRAHLARQAEIAASAYGDYRTLRRRENGDYVQFDAAEQGG